MKFARVDGQKGSGETFTEEEIRVIFSGHYFPFDLLGVSHFRGCKTREINNNADEGFYIK